MSRASNYLAIAFSLATIGSAVTPATAFAAQIFVGAKPHITAQLSPTGESRQASHVLGTVGGGPPKVTVAGLSSPGKVMIPAPGNSTLNKTSDLGKLAAKDAAGTISSVQTAQDTCANNPKLCPPTPKPPPCISFGCGNPQPIPCVSKVLSCPQQPKKDDDDRHGPVVILAPQVPVQVPVVVPNSMPARVAASTGSAAGAQAQPVITPQCMTVADNPPLASGIDQALPTAHLSDDDAAKVTELRQTIQLLATAGKPDAARAVEEVAMNLLGYQKVWVRCGAGAFYWQVASTDAGRQK